MNKDTHIKLIECVMEYCKWQDRFEHKGSDEAGIKARNALSEMRDLAYQRRKEIQAKRAQRKKLRNGKPGPPTAITKQDYA